MGGWTVGVIAMGQHHFVWVEKQKSRERERERYRQRLGREERSLAFGSSCVRVICVVHGVYIKSVRRAAYGICVSESDVCVASAVCGFSMCSYAPPLFRSL